MSYAIGVDYGTNSVRTLVVDVSCGHEIAEAVYSYTRGEEGILLDPRDPDVARQSPHDYIDGFFDSVSRALRQAIEGGGFHPEEVVGLGIDTTGSTPLPVDRNGVALGVQDGFRDRLAAQAWLWKDHTSHAESAEISRVAMKQGRPYLAKCGGTYSSEWYWSKILHCLRTAPDVAAATYSWVELADYIPAYITGNTSPETMQRSICAAGHKAMYHTDWGGLPSADFLDALQPGLSRFRYTTIPRSSNEKAGVLEPEAARRVGLPSGIPVAVGAFDAHMGAVGAGCRPGVLVKIIGTSTCDCVVAPQAPDFPDIPGLCGIVPGSILPGMYGLEAGQSAVGDIFHWFVKHLAPAEFGNDAAGHRRLTERAAQLRPGESGLIALDWNNGNRTVLVDPQLSGLLLGQSLQTTAPEVYRALIEATAFGALTIINRFEEYGISIDEVVNCGGIAEKNDLLLQIYADVCNRPMMVSRSSQTCALGAALFGAVVGGAHPDVATAQAAMTGVKEFVYEPVPQHVATYRRLYELYQKLHDGFAVTGQPAAFGGIMKELLAIRRDVRKGSEDGCSKN